MAAEILFVMKGPNMESVEFQLSSGHSLPATLFINLMTEKCQVINKHLRSTETTLRIIATVNNTTASIKFHDIKFEESELRQVVVLNQPDIMDQLIYCGLKCGTSYDTIILMIIMLNYTVLIHFIVT